MKKLKNIFLISILLISACKKDQSNNIGYTIIYGTIVDSQTGVPIEGVNIIKKFYNSSALNPIDTSVITTTDKDGKYALKLKIDVAETGNTNFSAICNGYCYNNLSYTNGAINECNIRLVKWAYLKLHCRNITPFDSNDMLWIDVMPAYGYDYFSWDFVGTNVDQIKVIPVIGYRSHQLHLEVTKNSISTNSYENIYFTGGDTIYRSISY